MNSPNQWGRFFTKARPLTSSGLQESTKPRSLNWPIVFFLIGLPVGVILSLLWVPIYTETLLMVPLWMIGRTLSITAGYHRLWSHKSYTASSSLKVAMAIIGAGAGQGSIIFWCRGHRAHHRYVDTDDDPYSIKKGFFHAHIGWMLYESEGIPYGVPINRNVDISDLKSDPIVRWQHRYYIPLFLLVGYAAPTLASGLLYGDYLGGFLYTGILAVALAQQGTFCVNSVAHWAGSQPFASEKSPRDSYLTGIFTLGEGYHNFHHEFPIDYRNGVRWYDADLTKWLIWTLSQLGLASKLRRFPQNEIEKGRIQRKWEILNAEGKTVSWGIPSEELPTMEWEEFKQQARTGCNFVVIRGVVHDVSAFVSEHPGGTALITGAIGKDATEMFEGGVYAHSGAASNLLDNMRVARIIDTVKLI
ncbi:Acyl-CoA desaturase [Penicillium verhagenii]|uniref:Acyl-CoA desaturase n=1 Tax=Penicillium verhagenii TaxID=1562060 RepID=UPI0025456995|nr:Acyl-CoA desaturase [Penicillium verhagenii]KAJ5939278.1 Acyl-CoA desaturase [Penicillium verhagenii]